MNEASLNGGEFDTDRSEKKVASSSRSDHVSPILAQIRGSPRIPTSHSSEEHRVDISRSIAVPIGSILDDLWSPGDGTDI